MEVEVRAKNYSKDDEGQSFVEKCTVIVKTTDDNGNVAEAEEKGCIVQGEQMTFLNSPKVYLPNLPTERQDIAGAFEEVLGKLQDGEGGDWQPPDWWIPVPEPEPYDVYILIQVENAGKNFSILLADEQGSFNPTIGTVNFDWGDGTTDSNTFRHTYTETGQYLIHITGDENVFFLRDWNFDDRYNGQRNIVGLIIKTGTNIAFRTDYYDENNYNYSKLFASKSFKYIKIMHPKGLPVEKLNHYFGSCYGLQKLELTKKISSILPEGLFYSCHTLKNLEQSIDFENVVKIGEYAFQHCYGLKKINFPNCTELETSAFAQCFNLTHANLPSCTAIGNYGFSQCYNLQEITTAEGCTFGGSCFQNCYSLYPRPDGSVN